VLAVFLTWLATWNPGIAAGIVAVLVLVTVVLIRWVWRALKSLFRGAEEELGVSRQG
jgi:hypothetical protein